LITTIKAEIVCSFLGHKKWQATYIAPAYNHIPLLVPNAGILSGAGRVGTLPCKYNNVLIFLQSFQVFNVIRISCP